MSKLVRRRFPYTTNAEWFRPNIEADWLALRATDVTATDAAALFGVSPYATPFELFHRKAGSLEVTFEESERMRWGKRLQTAIAEGICADNGWTIINRDEYLYVRSKSYVGMGASPDFIVYDEKLGVGTLEIKNVDKFVAFDSWSDDEAPPHIEFQLQHQLECAQLPWGAIGGLVGGNESRVHIRERDPEVGAEIGNRVTDLWRRVRDNDPPHPDYLKDANALSRIYLNASVGSVLDMKDVPEDVAERVLKLASIQTLAAKSEKLADEDVKNKKNILQDVILELHAEVALASEASRSAGNQKISSVAEMREIIKDNELILNVPGFKIKASTTHVDASTVERKAYSFRTVRITPVKEKTNV